MVEQIVDFALGFVICGLIGLSFLPLVSGRARRLTLARMESRLPMTFDEIEAERDLLRARFAVENRALEVKAAEARDGKAGDDAELGRRAVAVMRLSEQLEQTTTMLNERNAQLADSRAFGERTEATLKETRETLAQREADLTRLHGEFDRLAEEHRALDNRRRQLEAQFATATREIQDQRERLATSEAARKEISARAADLHSARESLAADLAEAERRAADFEARRARLLAKIAAERRRSEELENANLDLRRQIVGRSGAEATDGEGADEVGKPANGAHAAASAEQELLDLREAISRLGRQVAHLDRTDE